MLAVSSARTSLYSHSTLSTATFKATPLGSVLFQASTPTPNSRLDEGPYMPTVHPADACKKCIASPAVYECRVIRAEGLPVHLGHFRTTNYAVEISIDNDVKRTKHVLHGPNPQWNDPLFGSFSACDGLTPVTVRILRVRHMHHEEIVASKTLNIDLQNEVRFGDTARTMTWTLKCLGDFDRLVHSAVKITVAFKRTQPQCACNHDMTDGKSITETILDRVEKSLDTEWKGLVQAAQSFSGAVAHIAELHPYASLACKLLSYIPDKAAENLERDEQVKALCTVIKDTLIFVNDSDSLKHLHEGTTYTTQVKILARITHQITECFRFLRTYADEACLWTGMFKHILNAAHVDKHVRHYQAVVEHLLSSFRDNALLQIQIRIHRLTDHEDEFVIEHTTMADAHHAHSLLHHEKAHIRHSADHTHGVFDELTHWIEDPKHDATRAFLMVSTSGDASPVAHEVAWRYFNMGRLASSFTFDAPVGHDGRSMYHSPQMLIVSIARDLANFDGHFKSALRDAVATDPELAVSADCTQLFEQLILQPAKRLSVVGPVVIVVDGLHLGGANSERALLHSLLSSQLLQLPANFRFVLAMRADDEVEKILSPAVHKVSL